LIGFPEWQTTLAGGLIVGAIIALRGYTRLPGQVHTNAWLFGSRGRCYLPHRC